MLGFDFIRIRIRQLYLSPWGNSVQPTQFVKDEKNKKEKKQDNTFVSGRDNQCGIDLQHFGGTQQYKAQ